MTNPRLTDLTEDQQNVLYEKLSDFNSRRASYKTAGAFLIVLPHLSCSSYSLWIYSPDMERRSMFFLEILSPSFVDSLRTVSGKYYYSPRPILVVEYSEKHMHGIGEDLIPFGKYKGHYLSEIMLIDPNYISWIAHKFEARDERQMHFVKIADLYDSVYSESRLVRSAAAVPKSSLHIQKGESVKGLILKVISVRLEDDPYRSGLIDGHVSFFVNQNLQLADTDGNRFIWNAPAQYESLRSCHLASMEHAYHLGEILHVRTARVSGSFTSRGIPFVRINHVKLDFTDD
jgi:hypothetical protein